MLLLYSVYEIVLLLYYVNVYELFIRFIKYIFQSWNRRSAQTTAAVMSCTILLGISRSCSVSCSKSCHRRVGWVGPILDGRILADETGLRHWSFDVVLHFGVLFQPAKSVHTKVGRFSSIVTTIYIGFFYYYYIGAILFNAVFLVLW